MALSELNIIPLPLQESYEELFKVARELDVRLSGRTIPRITVSVSLFDDLKRCVAQVETARGT